MINVIMAIALVFSLALLGMFETRKGIWKKSQQNFLVSDTEKCQK
jgi:hypothetical protein